MCCMCSNGAVEGVAIEAIPAIADFNILNKIN
jgi:hypothetical protein